MVMWENSQCSILFHFEVPGRARRGARVSCRLQDLLCHDGQLVLDMGAAGEAESS
jgi:hypothetical protein